MPKKPKFIMPGKYKKGVIVTQAYNCLVEQLQPLDFFCTHSKGFLGFSIRFITGHKSSDRKAEYNHSGLIPGGCGCTLESLWTLKSQNFFERYEGKNVIIGRYNNLTPEKTLYALEETNKHINSIYPVHRLFLSLINTAHIFHWSKGLICSEYVAKVLYKAGARHYHYYGTTPDNLADEIENELNEDRTGPKYNIIFKSKLKHNFYSYCAYCNTYWLCPLKGHQYCPKCIKPFNAFNNSPNTELNKEIRTYNKLKKEYVNYIYNSK